MNYSIAIKYDGTRGGMSRWVTLGVSGCGFQCRNCSAQETWDIDYGTAFTEEFREELLRAINNPDVSGLVLTGGEPLYDPNLDDVLDLVKEFRTRYADSKTIWLYTGFLWEDIFHGDIVTFSGTTPKMKRREIVSQCDVLVDGRYVDELRDITLKWRGSSNQRVIDVKESLRQNRVVLWCD